MTHQKKLRVALLFGGRSTEHEVSVVSAAGVLNHMDKGKFEVLPVRISHEGGWELLDSEKKYENVEDLKNAEGIPVVLGNPLTRALIPAGGSPGKKSGSQNIPVDVVFPVLHGTFGEDGTIQGLVLQADLPCVGAGVLASAVGMDKVVMKQIFFQNDLPSPDFMWFLSRDWQRSKDKIREGIAKEVGYPCFVKASNTGSSVAVFKVHGPEVLDGAIGTAIQFDRKIVVEKAVDARELECSVLGNDDPVASRVGEVIPCHEFYDYDAKYVDESRIIIPAGIPEKIEEKVRKTAVLVFKAIDCAGMGRVDFLLERETDRIFVNEINTIPGFTPISMYPKLWEASGISYPELIGRLIHLALERHGESSRFQFRRI